MLASICRIHFHIYKSIQPDVLFKKGVQETISGGFSFIEITFPHGYSSVNMLHIRIRTPFSENNYRELLLYVVLNTEVVNVEVLSKQVENCLKYISVL